MKKALLLLLCLSLCLSSIFALTSCKEEEGATTTTTTTQEPSTPSDPSNSSAPLSVTDAQGVMYKKVGNAYRVDDTATTYSVNITIPATLNDLPVTSIGTYAFYKRSSLQSITIPNSVTSIDRWAFYGCDSLTSVYISDIAAWCGISFASNIANPLYYAKKLYLNGNLVTNLVIPNSVTSIGEWAFYGCENLQSITFEAGSQCTSIGEWAFCCDSLTSVYISDIAAWCSISFANYNANPLCYAENLYLNGNLVTNLVIPNSVTSIGDYAFDGCSSLQSVTIPNSVTTIGEWAFDGCSGLQSVTFETGSNCNSIGNSAFYLCSSLQSITIPNSVTSIGEYAFYKCSSLQYNIYDNAKYLGNSENPYVVLVDGDSTTSTIHPNTKIIYSGAFEDCRSLQSITIPNSVTSIGNRAFYQCRGLQSITIPNSVTSIGEYAFYKCSSLQSVTIPNSVTTIGEWAFYQCSSLQSVTFEAGSQCTSIGECAFYDCSSLQSITIPNSVTSIGDYAFSGCSGLQSITISNSVTSIGECAFNRCSSLQSITIPNSVTSIGRSAFYQCFGLQSIIFEDTTIWYRTTTSNHNYTGGTQTSVTSSSQNATYFRITYYDSYWYKK